MKTLIAMAGKGGTGKTTVAALAIRALLKDGASLLAIDADPNNNLWQAVGMDGNETVMDIVERIAQHKESIPAGMTKDRYIDMKIQEAVVEGEGFDLLSMGRPEGPGCYCYANNLLRDLIERLMDSYDTILIDNEAGLEHLSRRLVRSVDRMLIVSDFSAVGVRSAHAISRLIKELGVQVGRQELIINKVRSDINALKGEIEKTGLVLGGSIPYDDRVEDVCIRGASLLDLDEGSRAAAAVREILGTVRAVGGA